MNAPGGTVLDPAPGGNMPANSPTPTQEQLDAVFGPGNTMLATDEDGQPLLDDNGGYIVILRKGIQLANPVVIPEGVTVTLKGAAAKRERELAAAVRDLAAARQAVESQADRAPMLAAAASVVSLPLTESVSPSSLSWQSVRVPREKSAVEVSSVRKETLSMKNGCIPGEST